MDRFQVFKQGKGCREIQSYPDPVMCIYPKVALPGYKATLSLRVRFEHDRAEHNFKFIFY